MHAWNNTTFRAPALSQKFDQKLRLPRKLRLQNHQILRLSRTITLQNHQMARVPSKVTLQHHQMLRLPQKVSSFPFLTVALLLLSWLACSVSQLQHSFPELILFWVFLYWTFPWLNYSFLNCSFTELAFDELYLYCTLLLPNYSSTELVLYWTTPFFAF